MSRQSGGTKSRMSALLVMLALLITVPGIVQAQSSGFKETDKVISRAQSTPGRIDTRWLQHHHRRQGPRQPQGLQEAHQGHPEMREPGGQGG